MLFNSFEFLIFFLAVYICYLLVSHYWQNRLLLVASYIFYGAWDWRFLSLIFISTVVDYYCGIKVYETSDVKKKKRLVAISMCTNIGILGVFKYFNFFAENFASFLKLFNIEPQLSFLQVVLPVGISFYTFQTMSYTIDIYRQELKPTNKFFDFALFVSFFPQLVAGPIERAKHMIPQINKPRKITAKTFYEGCYLIFWGLFLKIVVADNLAQIVDPIFAKSGSYNGVLVLLSLYAFAFQIYSDFAGYSSIARGLSKLMGFNLMVNFNLPYFSQNPSEFWQRWHISLSSWLRDYLYIPLGGNRKGKRKTFLNLMTTMLIGGFWHGASWTFIVWGVYHGLLLVLHRLSKPILEIVFKTKSQMQENISLLVRIVVFFHFTCVGWLFFRAENLRQAYEMIYALFFRFQFESMMGYWFISRSLIFYLWLVVFVNAIQYLKKDFYVMMRTGLLIRSIFYFVCLYMIVVIGAQGGKAFIYFQF